jgi:CTP-dependent riboflavin kinase
MVKAWIQKLLGIRENVQRIEELEKNQADLLEIKHKLTNKLMEGRPQLRFVLEHLEDQEHLEKSEIVTELTNTFDISQTTAYRRINELEKELSYIEKTEKGYKALVSVN